MKAAEEIQKSKPEEKILRKKETDQKSFQETRPEKHVNHHPRMKLAKSMKSAGVSSAGKTIWSI